MNFYVYNVEGKILRVGNVPEELISNQAFFENELAISGYANTIRHKIVNGQLTLKTDEELTTEYNDIMVELELTLEQFKEKYSQYV